jgi:predicted GTPase
MPNKIVKKFYQRLVRGVLMALLQDNQFIQLNLQACKILLDVLDVRGDGNVGRMVMLPIIENYPPPIYKGKDIKIKYVTQLPTKSPAIAFFCNTPQYIKDSYMRFLENKLREHFHFEGIPVRLYFRKK